MMVESTGVVVDLVITGLSRPAYALFTIRLGDRSLCPATSSEPELNTRQIQWADIDTTDSEFAQDDT